MMNGLPEYYLTTPVHHSSFAAIAHNVSDTFRAMEEATSRRMREVASHK